MLTPLHGRRTYAARKQLSSHESEIAQPRAHRFLCMCSMIRPAYSPRLANTQEQRWVPHGYLRLAGFKAVHCKCRNRGIRFFLFLAYLGQGNIAEMGDRSHEGRRRKTGLSGMCIVGRVLPRASCLCHRPTLKGVSAFACQNLTRRLRDRT